MRFQRTFLCMGLLLCSSGLLAQQPTAEDDIRTKAKDYLRTLGEPGSPQITDITLLGAKWYRVRFVPGIERGSPDFNLLIINADGRLLHIGSNQKAVTTKPIDMPQLIADIAGPAKTDADYARSAAIYLKIWRPEETLLITRLKDIPKYEAHPLPADLAGIIRDGWSQPIGKNVRYTCYTYQQTAGLVERWEFEFENNQLKMGISNTIYQNVGDARWYR